MELIETEAGLILPGHPLFYDFLYSQLPPGWQDLRATSPGFAFVARAGSRVLEAIPESEIEEYVYGGELDEVDDDNDFL